eukprot:4660747-Amphidinium_carterae.3
MTADRQWSREVFNEITIPAMDTTMSTDYLEEEVIGKSIIEQYFTETRLNEKQPAHKPWVNKKSVQQPLDMATEDGKAPLNVSHAVEEDALRIQPLPGLDIPQQYVHPTSKAMAKPNPYKPLQASNQHQVLHN